MKIIYKITYPNKKIYIGQDVTGTLTYFGSVNSKLVEQDFSRDQMKSFTITKDILWESENASPQEINKMELHFILAHKSNNPEIGYNRRPHFIPMNAAEQGAAANP